MPKVLPASLVASLLLSWVVPLFVRDVIQDLNGAFEQLWPSFVPYLFYFLVVLAAFALLVGIEHRWALWQKAQFNGKALYIATSYFAASVSYLAAIITLCSCYPVEYFGGDSEGSFGMGCFPTSIVVAALAGIAIAIRWTLLLLMRLAWPAKT